MVFLYIIYYLSIICIMNLLTRERFPKGFNLTASVAKWIGHWSRVQEVVVESCSRQINFSLIIESKLSKSTQMSESRNSMQTIDY